MARTKNARLYRHDLLRYHSDSSARQLLTVSQPELGLEFAIETNSLIESSEEGTASMDVNGVRSAYGAYAPHAKTLDGLTGNSSSGTPSVGPKTPLDELQLSSVGRMLDKLSQNSEVRAERLAQIREAIANGTYDTEAKLEAALEKMFAAEGIRVDRDE
jgi:anti-sigma28 factor (negative regulator of flagellin synthesis)